MKNRFVRPLALAAIVLASSACSDASGIAGPQHDAALGQVTLESSGNSSARRPGASQPALLVCPSAVTYTASATIGREGGSLSAGGTTITLPSSAVNVPTVFTLTVPASDYVEIEIVAGNNQHFKFEKRVAITIDYSRCGFDTNEKPLTAWHIDTRTKALLQQMGSRTNRDAASVEFGTDHLSGYALAW